jgi:secreted PhoX family phosphatase
MVDLNRRNLMKTSVAAALGASVAGVASGDDGETNSAPMVKGELKRFSSTAFGAEVTGPVVFPDGTPLFSLQHPSRDNPAPYNRSGVGYFSGFQFEMNGTNDDFEELSTPQTNAQQGVVRGASGEYTFLGQEGDPINGGTERLGVTQTPDGTDINTDNFAGTQYGDAAYNPDCNEFIPTNEEETEGYLFTNWENSPGNISRIPVTRTEDGEIEADLENAMNLANTEELRSLGGTRINCYGDTSPWGTMVSAEENYAHPRVGVNSSVGDIMADGTGDGHRGASQFWNRPNPSEIQGVVDELYGDDSWYVQGYWALSGVEFLAYYLGAEQVDQGSDGNLTEPISDTYPNPYRYGYFVDFREPGGDPPQPVKYYVMGRAGWEAPDFQSDLRTVYGASDGDNKGIYKFVADGEIPSYDDPMDVSGTLYAPLVTNADAARGRPPGEVDLDLEWIPLGSATNREVESWIAEYDGVDQVDYLESHAETDWEEDLETALEEADREVADGGNRDYITDEEIALWAAQYQTNGPDGVSPDLRRVPFLETRAAAREIGATIEFRKAEGVDSVDDAGPGEFIYFGISELNTGMSDDAGEIQLDRVDGGVVYRAEIEPDYNVSRLEPVIVGPDATDPADVADDALINIDNVRVMDDGRVLCCEDADQFGRSYSNDCLYVFDPEEDAGGPSPPANPDPDPGGPPAPDVDQPVDVSVRCLTPSMAAVTVDNVSDVPIEVRDGASADVEVAGDGLRLAPEASRTVFVEETDGGTVAVRAYDVASGEGLASAVTATVDC